MVACSSGSDKGEIHGQRKLWLPIRRFREESLRTSNGESILERLLTNCTIVIIQDADLRPADLMVCRAGRGLHSTLAIDMTKALGLKANYLYVLGQATDSALNAVSGERLW